MAMETELLVVLIIAAVALAWWAGRRSARRPTPFNQDFLPAHYFQGLNYVLNEQPDKAIEVFIKLIEVDNETVETHFALGNLFRRRGEVERAIRIHQNLIARPTLSMAQRTQALYELGLDYMRSGILSRAEAVFQQLTDDAAQGTAALRQLVDIYQQERDWTKAIDALTKQAELSGTKQSAVIAQYHCELAELARAERDSKRAQECIAAALANDPKCVRASLLAAEIALQAGQPKQVISELQRVEQQDPDYLSEIFVLLLQAYEQLGRSEQATEYLRNVYVRYGGVAALLHLTDLLRKQKGDAVSAEFMAEQLRTRPSMRGMHRLIELNLNLASGSEQARNQLLVLRELTVQLFHNKPIYKCRQCGFNAKALHWQCPGCKSWSSVKPVDDLEGG
ncbi:MAG: lipopolysaccharide assembly protein LapB [Gammaproteobacteria bacterium]|nr:lipopolysaccharide assembly protein LapB [Gammaproteobacteria bacterium]